MPKTRTWISLGTTSLDLDTVVKIVFEKADARLFAVSGEALIMTAWTNERADIAKLKQLASPSAGWVEAKADVRETESVDQRLRLSAIDKLVLVETNVGLVAELFACEVFLGQVAGDAAIDAAKRELGIKS